MTLKAIKFPCFESLSIADKLGCNCLLSFWNFKVYFQIGRMILATSFPVLQLLFQYKLFDKLLQMIQNNVCLGSTIFLFMTILRLSSHFRYSTMDAWISSYNERGTARS